VILAVPSVKLASTWGSESAKRENVAEPVGIALFVALRPADNPLPQKRRLARPRRAEDDE
jgi:hypothetical protein